MQSTLGLVEIQFPFKVSLYFMLPVIDVFIKWQGLPFVMISINCCFLSGVEIHKTGKKEFSVN